MASTHLSLRVDPKTIERLDEESRRQRRSRSEIAKTLIEEGLRMEAHPGIIFRDGPTGRRAALSGRLDVWELINVYRDFAKSRNPVKKVAEYLVLTEREVETGLRYYAEFREEIDERIRRNEEESERAFQEWLRERQVVGR